MDISPLLSWITWDPNPEAFTIPILDRPVRWYGIFWVSGFIFGYFAMLALFKQFILNTSQKTTEKEASALAFRLVDKMTWYVILGALIGARLGHVLFYDWPYHREHPLEILKVWEGGLASHGGALGTMLGVWLFQRQIRTFLPSLSFVALLDLICLPTALVAALIRTGNFVNQEISGTSSVLPWAVQFMHPYDGYSSIPRHPVQLYEALFYFTLFILLSALWIKRKGRITPGKVSGLFFLGVFGGRALLEPFKAPLGNLLGESLLSTGQLLSLPFIILGFFLLSYNRFISHKASFS